MLSLVRLLCTDIDGTLAVDGSVSPANRRALIQAHAAGLQLAYLTGRPAAESLALLRAHDLPGLLGSSNGAMFFDVGTGRQLAGGGNLTPSDTRRILELVAQIVPNAGLAADLGSRVIVEPAFLRVVPAEWDHHVKPSVTEHAGRTGAVKLLVAALPNTAGIMMSQLRTALTGLAEVTRSTERFIEISRLGVNKGSGLHTLADLAGVGLDETAAIGDMPNDLPMLACAGVAAAVGNAHPEVLAAADVVVADCRADGVAQFVGQLLAHLYTR